LNAKDLRTNHFQEEGYGGGPFKRPHVGLVTRSMTRRMEKEDGFQKTFLL